MMKTQQLFDLTGKTALVTGAAGLLGRQFCKTLAGAGAKLVLVDLDHHALKDLETEMVNEGYTVLAIPGNITEAQACKQMVHLATEAFDSLDILVNSAALDPKFDPQQVGQQAANAFETYPLEAWQQALNVNLTGLFLVTQAAVQPMLKMGKGVIINLCSIYGLNGPDQRLYQKEGQPPQFKPVTYSTTKAGVIGFTKYLAAYYAGKNIRVNALTPGGVFNQHDEEFTRNYNAHAILGRMAQKDEMNGALLFLASEASAYMTGANLVVDGGWSAW